VLILVSVKVTFNGTVPDISVGVAVVVEFGSGVGVVLLQV